MPTVTRCGFCWANSKGSVPSASPTARRGWSRWACKPSARNWTGKESTGPDRDAKLDRIEYVTSACPDRCFAFDQSRPPET